ncbi:hypothetical protein ABK040_008301 [Willaertia magna]
MGQQLYSFNNKGECKDQYYSSNIIPSTKATTLTKKRRRKEEPLQLTPSKQKQQQYLISNENNNNNTKITKNIQNKATFQIYEDCENNLNNNDNNEEDIKTPTKHSPLSNSPSSTFTYSSPSNNSTTTSSPTSSNSISFFDPRSPTPNITRTPINDKKKKITSTMYKKVLQNNHLFKENISPNIVNTSTDVNNIQTLNSTAITTRKRSSSFRIIKKK